MEIVENILQSNHEIKEEPLDYYELTQKSRNSEQSCSKTLFDDENLKQHMKICHKCELCDITFSNEEDLKLHMVKHIKICLKCKSCNNSFSDEEDLTLHMKVKHGKIRIRKSDEEDLKLHKLHMKVNHSKIKNVLNKIVAKKNVCDSCGKHFTSNYNLKTHFKTVHEKRRDFICMDCGKCFGTLAQKNRHANTHK